MSDDDNDYKAHQQKWEDLNEGGQENPEKWEGDELLNNEELLAAIEADIHSEREARERVREEFSDDANEGHDERIEKLNDTAQTVRNKIAYCKGEYTYDEEEEAQEAEQAQEQESEIEAEEEEAESPDIEIESDSD